MRRLPGPAALAGQPANAGSAPGGAGVPGRAAAGRRGRGHRHLDRRAAAGRAHVRRVLGGRRRSRPAGAGAPASNQPPPACILLPAERHRQPAGDNRHGGADDLRRGVRPARALRLVLLHRRLPAVPGGRLAHASGVHPEPGDGDDVARRSVRCTSIRSPRPGRTVVPGAAGGRGPRAAGHGPAVRHGAAGAGRGAGGCVRRAAPRADRRGQRARLFGLDGMRGAPG